MTDMLNRAARSALMSRIKGKNTSPERTVRSHLHAAGFRFRLHDRNLPGSPDIVLPRLRTAIFVHGCFWHRHQGCHKTTTPSTRRAFWTAKFEANVKRDARKIAELKAWGWRVVVVWECQVSKGTLESLLSGLHQMKFKSEHSDFLQPKAPKKGRQHS